MHGLNEIKSINAWAYEQYKIKTPKAERLRRSLSSAAQSSSRKNRK